MSPVKEGMATLTARLMVAQGVILLGAVVIAVSWLSQGGQNPAASAQGRARSVAATLASSPDLSPFEGEGRAVRLALGTIVAKTGVAAAAVLNRSGVTTVAAGLVHRGQIFSRAAGGRSYSGAITGYPANLIFAIRPFARGPARGYVLIAVRAPAGLPVTPAAVVRGVEAVLLALLAGGVGSWVAGRWVRKQTFGLELDGLTRLIQEQEAMFHGIREGVVGLDQQDRVLFANAEAQRLLSLPRRHVNRPAAVLIPAGRLQAIVRGEVEGRDLVVVHQDRILLVNRRPVEAAGRPLGYVVTLNDRTESEAILRELDGMLGLTEALRAQAHDFSNRMHTVVGLIELGAIREAVEFATDLAVRDTTLMDRLTAEVGNPVAVALLLAKAAVAAERNVKFLLGPSVELPADLRNANDLVTVIGNLLDNAIDAAQPGDCPWVEVRFARTGAELTMEVADSGPGVPVEHLQEIFVDGYSTKPARHSMRRGLGLAMVHQLVTRYGGSITVGRETGAVFTVRLPSIFPEVVDHA